APAFKTDGPESSRVCEAGARVALDFGVKDQGAPAAYSASHLPAGAALDAQSGLFSWDAPREGAYTFVVQAERGATMAAKRVSLFVAASRSAAISKATEKAEPASSIAAAREAYEDALRQATEAAAGADGETFHSKLFRLQDAVAALEPLTPLLPDGSLDFSRCVTSPQILPVGLSRLTDGNSDTFPWNERPSDGSFYVFDFGLGFRFSADALGLQGRLNFEERGGDVLFFGSNDGTSWTRLTATPTPFSTSLIREEVYPEQKSARFRYLKVQKRGGFMELSEVRIYGQRFEVAPGSG
ncbi:MAG TPA: putative Ig domain-containing protein, partial [Candidatus Methylacidiphilales bacterium]